MQLCTRHMPEHVWFMSAQPTSFIVTTETLAHDLGQDLHCQ